MKKFDGEIVDWFVLFFIFYFKKALIYPDLPDAEGSRKAIASIEAAQRQKKGKEN